MLETNKTSLSLTEEAKLVQVYGHGDFSTVVEGNYLYLLSTTKIAEYNIIATFDINENYVIYNRDKANVFVDWSHEAFSRDKSVQIDALPDTKIAEHLINYLREDINALLVFKSTEKGDILEQVINVYPEDTKVKILKGLERLKVSNDYKVSYIVPSTEYQMKHLYDKKYYYACFDTQNKKFEMTNSNDFSIVIKNGSCGSWKQISNNPKSFVFFFNKSDCPLANKDICNIIEQDLLTNPYEAANKFIVLEDKFTKGIDTAIEIITSKQGTIDLSLTYYPVMEDYANSIAKTLGKYKKATIDSEKAECMSDLKNLYSNAYNELQKAQDSLKKLHSVIEGIK